MFEGLFFIHNNKIIHRDMKAANILITRQVKSAQIVLSKHLIILRRSKNFNEMLHCHAMKGFCHCPLLILIESYFWPIKDVISIIFGQKKT